MVSVYSRGIRTASESHADSKLDAEKVEKKVVDKGDLVYIGTMARLVRFVKIFSISTSLMGISVQPLIYNQVADLHWALALMVGSVASFFVFVTPVLLHIITKRYVTRMYWDSETNKFSATTYSLFLRELEHNFIAEQVVVPSTPGIFTTILVNGGKTPLFLDPSLFVDKRALIHLLRYNEPLDWEIPPTLSRPNERSNDAARSAAQTKTDTKH
jgi:transmembrane protein 70